MANREDNLKKINAELEMMSDNELEQVVGGNIGQTSYDSKVLYDHGLMDTWYGNDGLVFGWKSKSAAVDEGWSRAGITCYTSPFCPNRYWVSGREISRQQAFDIVKSKFKKIHTVSDE